jgi:predicted nucleic acid-binding protein
MRVFLDTNILVDVIADRKPFSSHAVEIFRQAETGRVQLFTSSHSLATTYYLLKKYVDERRLREILLHVMDFVEVVAVDCDALQKGLRSRHKDLEDAIQIVCASSISGLSCIVTRNVRDFKTSEIVVLTPDEFCLKH